MAPNAPIVPSASAPAWRLGIHLGPLGRAARVLSGGLLLLNASFLLFVVGPTTAYGAAGFHLLAALVFAVLATGYLVAHRLGAAWFAAQAPWVGTVLLVAPVLFLLAGPFAGIGLGDVVGAPALDGPLVAATSGYVGVSLLLAAWSGYGGCEVVALGDRLTGKRFATYCVPLVVVDALDHALVRRHEDAGRARGRRAP